MMKYNFTSFMANVIEDFIDYKHSCGLKYYSEVNILEQFDRHCLQNKREVINLDRELVMSFLEKRENERITNVANKATVIRGLGKYLINVKKMDNVFLVPTISTRGQETYIPYVFNKKEISKILYHSRNYISHTPNVLPNIRNIVSCTFTMLYCTGMRNSEVINLKLKDVDFEKNLIYINEAKNDNKRIVTISESLKKECLRYLEESKKYSLSNIYFFDTGIDKNQGRLHEDILYRYFRELLKKCEISHKGRGVGPRLHDLRHSFCVHSLKQLSGLEGDINSYIYHLSIFLGHKSIYETQKYLWLTSELFEDTLSKTEEYTSFITTIFEEGYTDE